METDRHALAQKAEEARTNAHCPYSGFAVGAALLGESGRVYTGCNVENASYGLTCCAERTAVFKAISEGERRFAALALCGGEKGKAAAKGVTPCGACRQVLAEFCGPDLPVLMAAEGEMETLSLGQLLPYAFELEKD